MAFTSLLILTASRKLRSKPFLIFSFFYLIVAAISSAIAFFLSVAAGVVGVISFISGLVCLPLLKYQEVSFFKIRTARGYEESMNINAALNLYNQMGLYEEVARLYYNNGNYENAAKFCEKAKKWEKARKCREKERERKRKKAKLEKEVEWGVDDPTSGKKPSSKKKRSKKRSVPPSKPDLEVNVDWDEPTVDMKAPKMDRNTFRKDIKIIRKIGSGGFSDVFLAKDGGGNQIALKRAQGAATESLDDKAVKRFVKEAKNWKKLFANEDVREGIVAIYDYGERPEPYIVMEYMDSGNLRKRLRALSFDDKLRCLNSVLDTLHIVHHLGVIHRDIKPENILQNSSGQWKIADWGLSKVLLDSGGSTTQAGMIKATLSYAAPEQIQPDKFGKVDWRTDIYQAGALAYEMFTGKKPFTGDPARLVFDIISTRPKHPSDINRKVPRSMGDAIMRALEKNKKKRFKDASAFREALL